MTPTFRRALFTTALTITTFLFAAPLAFAQSVSLSWTAPTTNEDGSALNGDLYGYRIYWGTTAGVYSTGNKLVTGTGGGTPPTSTTVTGLTSGMTYYFVAKSVDFAGNESSNYSNSVSGVAVGVTTTTTTTRTTTTTTRTTTTTTRTTTTSTTTTRTTTTSTSTTRTTTTSTSTTRTTTTSTSTTRTTTTSTRTTTTSTRTTTTSTRTTTTSTRTTTTSTRTTTTTTKTSTTTTNTGTTTTVTSSTTTTTQSPSENSAGLRNYHKVVDFDGDGLSDPTLVLPPTKAKGKTKVSVLLAADGSTRSFTLGSGQESAAFGDYDGDGATDIAWVKLGSKRPTWTIIDSSTSVKRAVTLDAGVNLALSGCDFDGDGKVDLAGLSAAKKFFLRYLSSGAAVKVDVEIALPQGAEFTNAYCTDFNADGRDDLVAVEKHRANNGNEIEMVWGFSSSGQFLFKKKLSNPLAGLSAFTSNETTGQQGIVLLQKASERSFRLVMISATDKGGTTFEARSTAMKTVADLDFGTFINPGAKTTPPDAASVFEGALILLPTGEIRKLDMASSTIKETLTVKKIMGIGTQAVLGAVKLGKPVSAKLRE